MGSTQGEADWEGDEDWTVKKRIKELKKTKELLFRGARKRISYFRDYAERSVMLKSTRKENAMS